MVACNDVILMYENTYRILWIDKNLDMLYIMDIYDTKAKPIKLKLSKINKLLLDKNCTKIDDPYFYLRDVNLEISEKYQEIRDDAYSVISDLVKKENFPYILEVKYRTKLIKEKCLARGYAKSSTYRHLKRYLQRGMNVNALLPDYCKCGNKGIEKSIASNIISWQIPKSITNFNNIGREIKVSDIFNYAIEEWYLKEKKKSLKHAYMKMINVFYENNTSAPSLRQFRYWFNNRNSNRIDDLKSSEDVKCSISNGNDDRYSIIKNELKYMSECSNKEQEYNIKSIKNYNPGYVYIIENEFMPNLYKIGKTNGNIKTRINQISSTTGVPTPFEEVVSVLVPDSNLFEKELHKKFFKERINSRREFFKFEDRFEIISETIKMVFEVFSKEDFEANDDLRASYKSICKLGRIFKISI